MSEIIVIKLDELKAIISETVKLNQVQAKQKLMTAQEINDEFGIPKKTLDALRQERAITYYRYSKEYRYDRESLERYIDSTMVPAKKAI
ncbi:MAG: helix-turn-helix domain-containing protein [Sulfurovaceae bacterium]|nr:helix-turn-helix domain-containing protein [Sulfurovaceae bacterium]